MVLGVWVECETTGVVDHQYKPAPGNLCTMDIPPELEGSPLGPGRIQLVPHQLSLFGFLSHVRFVLHVIVLSFYWGFAKCERQLLSRASSPGSLHLVDRPDDLVSAPQTNCL